MCNLKEKFIKFLTFVLFFNFLFLHINYVFAMSASSTGIGPKDRVRTYEQQNFTYSQYEGFNCSVGGLIPKSGGMDTSVTGEGISKFKNIMEDAGRFAAFLGKTLIHFTQCSAAGLMVTGIVSGIADYISPNQRTQTYQQSQLFKSKSASLTSAGSAVLLIASTFFDKMLDEWLEWAIGQDDFQVDTEEKSCSWISMTNTAICVIIGVAIGVAKAFVDSVIAKIIIISVTFIVSVIVDAILMLMTLTPFRVAATNFDKISLCGDEWLTVGNDELEDKIKDSYDTKISTMRIVLNRKDELKYKSNYKGDFSSGGGDARYQYNGFGVSTSGKPEGTDSVYNDKLPIKYYPTRGEFNGSYKYILNQCFGMRDFTACKKLFKEIDNNTKLEDLFTYNNKRYREFVYGGMEYEYTGCTDNRPERAQYGTGKGQLYYFRGTEAANFACERFLTSADYKNDYKCCVEASQKLVCIKSKVESGKISNTAFLSSDSSNIGFNEVYTMCDKDNNGNCTLPLASNIPDEDKQTDTCSTISNLFNGNGLLQKAFETVETDVTTDDDSDSNNNNNNQVEIDKNKTETNKLNKASLLQKANCGTSSSTASNERSKMFWKNISFKIVPSVFEGSKYCVQTTNLCPYNFYIGGGTEYYGSDFSDSQTQNTRIIYKRIDNKVVGEREKTYVWDESNEQRNINLNCEYAVDEESRSCGDNCKFGIKICKGMSYKGSTNGSGEDEYYDSYRKPSNFCQVDRHCVYIPKPVSDIKSKDFSAYLDKACLNFVGSSHNFEGYKNVNATSDKRLSNQKTLVAPIVECTVETLKHMLLNEAGHTKCNDPREASYDDKTCDSGTEYIKGQQLDEIPDYKNKNSFLTVKKALENAVKALAVLMVCIMGFKIAFGDHRFDGIIVLQKSVALIFVLYFALSNNWVRPVFKAVFGISNSVVSLAYSAVTEKGNIFKNDKYYGCYFFKNDYISNNYKDYGDRNYLAIFDSFDCKMSLYMGFMGDTMRHPPILGIFIASILTFGVVIWLLFPYILIFAGLILITLKITFIFISSNLVCILLLFLSPVMIPMFLFDKTKNIFDAWLRTIEQTFYTVGMLIIGVAIFLAVFDKYFIGDARFIGEKTPIRDVYCGKICKVSDNDIIYITKDDVEIETKCSKEFGGKVINLQYDAPICFLTSKLKTKSMGLGTLDFLVGNAVSVASLVISTALMFTNFLNMVFLCILIYLFDQFIGYISGTAKSIFGAGFNDDIFGGGALPSLSDVMKSATNVMSGVANYGHRNNPLTIASKRNKIGSNEKVNRSDISAAGDNNNDSSVLEETNNKETESNDKTGNRYELHIADNVGKKEDSGDGIKNK